MYFQSEIGNLKSRIETASAGFEPATSRFEFLRSKSVELRSLKTKREREDSNLQPAPSHGAALNSDCATSPRKFWILDFGFRLEEMALTRNPKSNCEVRGEEITFFFTAFGGENLTGALGFEPRTSVLETDILPIETTRL